MSGIAVISHHRHIYTWRGYRDEGFPICSSWINDLSISNRNAYKPNWLEREREFEYCSCVFIYSNCEDLVASSLLEVGMAIGYNKNMYALGTFKGIRQLQSHPQFLFRSFPEWDVRKVLQEAQSWDKSGLADRIRESRSGKTQNIT